MKSQFIPAIRVFALMTLLLGIGYPLLITVTAQTFFRDQANGSLMRSEDRLLGSYLLAQKMESERYFWARPSASDFGAVPSGASNLGPTSKALAAVIADRKAKGFSDELLFASGSGLDPHIAPGTALRQVARIVESRGLGDPGGKRLNDLILSLTEGRTLGVLGEVRVNVNKLNLALDENFRN